MKRNIVARFCEMGMELCSGDTFCEVGVKSGSGDRDLRVRTLCLELITSVYVRIFASTGWLQWSNLYGKVMVTRKSKCSTYQSKRQAEAYNFLSLKATNWLWVFFFYPEWILQHWKCNKTAIEKKFKFYAKDELSNASRRSTQFFSLSQVRKNLIPFTAHVEDSQVVE